MGTTANLAKAFTHKKKICHNDMTKAERKDCRKYNEKIDDQQSRIDKVKAVAGIGKFIVDIVLDIAKKIKDLDKMIANASGTFEK